uniref:Uncharacterized protein n=1 Tax=Arundo donax TaxID=35708 RepID=A0A0A9G5K4_ARUDO
MSMSSFSRQK